MTSSHLPLVFPNHSVLKLSFKILPVSASLPSRVTLALHIQQAENHSESEGAKGRREASVRMERVEGKRG